MEKTDAGIPQAVLAKAETSTGSPKGVPVPCSSTTVSSEGLMPASEQAKWTACSWAMGSTEDNGFLLTELCWHFFFSKPSSTLPRLDRRANWVLSSKVERPFVLANWQNWPSSTYFRFPYPLHHISMIFHVIMPFISGKSTRSTRVARVLETCQPHPGVLGHGRAQDSSMWGQLQGLPCQQEEHTTFCAYVTISLCRKGVTASRRAQHRSTSQVMEELFITKQIHPPNDGEVNASCLGILQCFIHSHQCRRAGSVHSDCRTLQVIGIGHASCQCAQGGTYGMVGWGFAWVGHSLPGPNVDTHTLPHSLNSLEGFFSCILEHVTGQLQSQGVLGIHGSRLTQKLLAELRHAPHSNFPRDSCGQPPRT